MKSRGDIDGIPVMLVGNKCDETNREVSTNQGEAFAKQWQCAFMETSAKTNHNVRELLPGTTTDGKEKDNDP